MMKGGSNQSSVLWIRGDIENWETDFENGVCGRVERQSMKTPYVVSDNEAP